MNVVKKIMLSAAVIMLSLSAVGNVYASSGSSSVTVSYTPDRISAYVRLRIEVEGKGEVLDMDQSIRNGTMTFDMREGETKTLGIHPDDDYVIGSVEYFDGYDTSDLKKQMKNNLVGIIVRDQNAVLKIRFEKKINSESDNSTDDKNGTESNRKPVHTGTLHVVQTDDVTNKEMILMLMGVSLILILVVWKRNRDNRKETETSEAENIDERK